MMREQTTRRLPVTILTGFLGAGKTTLLNRILRETHGQRVAVIENEFGETGVDGELIFAEMEGTILEMNNGCICCTVRGDLIRILRTLHERHADGTAPLDRVIIETTGLADPSPLAQTFFVDEAIGQAFRLDAIVTVVDALHGGVQLDEHHEAQEQVGFADRILVSKLDLVDEAAAKQLSARLRRMNARAPINPVHFGQTDIRELLDISGFNLDAILSIEPDFLTDNTHEHDDDVTSFAFQSEEPLHPASFDAFLQDLLAAHAPDLLRFKGVLRLHGEPRRAVLQGVHMIAATDFGRPWRPDERAESRIVFIGRKLPKEAILLALAGCNAGNQVEAMVT